VVGGLRAGMICGALVFHRFQLGGLLVVSLEKQGGRNVVSGTSHSVSMGRRYRLSRGRWYGSGGGGVAAYRALFARCCFREGSSGRRSRKPFQNAGGPCTALPERRA
jgi:hypothetical protein